MEGVEVGLAGTADQRAAAFSRLLDRSMDRSLRLAAVILCNREEAEDAMADAALRAWQHVSSLRDPAKFDAWFSRILVNVCRDRLRTAGARPRPSASIPRSMPTHSPIPSSAPRCTTPWPR